MIGGVHGIHQMLPVLVRGDAIGNYTVLLQRLFRSWGHDSLVFSGYHSPDAPAGGRAPMELQEMVGLNDVVILHYGVYCWELQAFLRCRARKVICYHNITPPSFFVHHSLRHYYVTAIGRLLLPAALRGADMVLTPSLYNKRECDALGAKDCRVLPLVLDFDDLDHLEPDRDVLYRYRDGRTNIIFVGRLSPNKRQENVISAFARYRSAFDPDARLLLIGHDGGLEVYSEDLRAHVRRLGVENVVIFTGHISVEELVAYYRVANVFLCLSEHEGFAVPLIEAMHFGVPVVALARGAVAGTLRNAGVLIEDLDFDQIAAVLARLHSDETFRATVLARQARRLRDFAPAKLNSMLRLYLEDLDK
jgi:glycosyltransferase involved in cell wall biosynthesis